MKYLWLIFPLALMAVKGCGNDDDGDGPCSEIAVEWNTPTFSGEENWLLISDENGSMLRERKVDGRSSFLLSTGQCTEQKNLTFLRVENRRVLVGNQLQEVTIYDAITYLDIPDGLQFDTLKTSAALRAFAVEGVSSLELLLWPEESKGAFSGNLFIDPQAGLLSFEIPAVEGQPAFLVIRANGEAENRYLWVDAIQDFNYTFSYEDLGKLNPYGPVLLPNQGKWEFQVRGRGTFGSTRLDYSFMPSLISGEFGAALPPITEVDALQLMAREVSFLEGQAYYPITYEKEAQGLPAAIPLPDFDIELSRLGRDRLQAAVPQGTVDALEVRFSDNSLNAGGGPWLRWSVIGPPEAMADFQLPQWPQPLESTRRSLLDESRNTAITLTGKAYDGRPTYRELLEAAAAQDTDWEARQGMLARSKAY